MHVPRTTVTRIRFPALCSYLIEVTLIRYEESVVQFDSTNHRRFSSGTPVLEKGYSAVLGT